jgi:hypothetical protein
MRSDATRRGAVLRWHKTIVALRSEAWRCAEVRRDAVRSGALE